jgi:hypothetical protein
VLRLLWVSIALVLSLSAPRADATTAATLALDGGGSYLSVPNAPDLNPTGGITIEAWIRPTSFTGFPTIVGKSYLDSYWLGLSTTGRLRYYTHGTGSSRDGVRPIPLGQWTHVAVSFDGTTRRYYVDGALDLELATPAALPINTLPLGIGADSNGSFDFEGNLAEVRIWAIARTQDEIRADLVRQLDRDEPGLVAVWNLDGSAAELLGRFEATPHGTASFAGQQAPPEPFFPLRIPRLGSGSNPNGLCGAGEYGPLRLPVWTNATYEPSWIWVGATQLTLHFCFDELRRESSGFASTASVQLDRNASGGALTELNDDLRFGLREDGTTLAQRGVGGVTGGWTTSTLGSFFQAATDGSQEFSWDAEMTVSRLLLSSVAGSEFGLSLLQRDVLAALDSFGWPQGAAFATPDTWDLAYVDDTNLPRADSENPLAGVNPRVLSTAVPGGRAVSLRANAIDDVDLATLEIWVDGAIVEICDLTGTDDVSGTCLLETALPFGMHYASGVARDHRGRVGASRAAGFRVQADGLAPALTISHTPQVPAPGGVAQVTAHATDPTGITRIDISLDAPPYSRHCAFAPGVTDASCAVDVPFTGARSWFHYSAEAEDVEEFVAREGPRTVVTNAPGTDTDADGLPDSLEFTLCTREDSADTDLDGLTDGWEIRGLQVPGGAIVDLPGLGADPCRRDVFLQYDYEVGAAVESGVIDDMVAAMRAKGIALHVEQHERPRPPDNPASSIGAVEAAFQVDEDGDYWFAPERNWTHFYAYSRHRVGRSGAWGRYFTFDIYGGYDDCVCPFDAADPSACHSPDAPRCWRENRDGQSRRFLHELGHSMGLGHGGQTGFPLTRRVGEYLFYDGINWDNDNHKPNHVSVMNYGYNGGLYCGTPVSPGRRTGMDLVGKLTYSEANFGDLDENALDERPTSAFATALRAQSCAHTTAGHIPVARHTCFDARQTASGTDTEARVLVITDGTNPLGRLVALGGWSYPDPAVEPNGVDFDCDGVIETASADNVNGDNADWTLPREVCNGVDDDGDGAVDLGCGWFGGQTLRGVEEWSRIPRPPNCIALYLGPDRSCYPQPAAYRAGIGVGGTALDCRVRALPAEPDVDCPSLPNYFAAPYSPIEQPEEEFAPMPPGVEFCNADDDDGDGAIDEGCRDTDGDGVSDVIDSCPRTSNADQLDADGDGVGDACASPAQPGNLLAQDGPNGRVISWKPLGGDVAGVRVYRESLVDGSLTHLGETQSSSFTDTSADPNEPVRYRVVPLDPLGAEAIESTATIPAPEPAAVALAAVGVAALSALTRRRALRIRPSRTP